MSQSFGLVENKTFEAAFFLNLMQKSPDFSHDAKCFFSAFVSASRSITLALQATLRDTPGFDDWYEGARNKLKADPFAPYFVQIRNDAIHRGMNPLNHIGFFCLDEHLANQLNDGNSNHVLMMPMIGKPESTMLANASEACSDYFKSILQVVFECYSHFKKTVDPQWYFTRENFNAANRSIQDAVSEMGYPPDWLDVLPEEQAWCHLRRQHASCLLNDLFETHLGLRIPSPDDQQSATEGI